MLAAWRMVLLNPATQVGQRACVPVSFAETLGSLPISAVCDVVAEVAAAAVAVVVVVVVAAEAAAAAAAVVVVVVGGGGDGGKEEMYL